MTVLKLNLFDILALKYDFSPFSDPLFVIVGDVRAGILDSYLSMIPGQSKPGFIAGTLGLSESGAVR